MFLVLLHVLNSVYD